MMSSTSKITNTRATRKKWILNESRNSAKVLNPHSKGLWSSRSVFIFFITLLPSTNRARETIVIDINRNKRLKIIDKYIINFGYLQFHKLLFYIKLNYSEQSKRYSSIQNLKFCSFH